MCAGAGAGEVGVGVGAGAGAGLARLARPVRLMLGPMVRVSTLPLRLLALRWGAHVVYSPEIVDHGLLRSRKLYNDELKTVDFIQGHLKCGRITFRTCDEEKHKVVLQLGTSDPENAVEAAILIQDYVSGVDVNMGCPKDFSVNYGMGAALMSNPKKACDILTALVQNLKVPVTCKIRIFPSVEQTLDFVNNLIPTGISAIAIHGRTKEERPTAPDHPDYIKYLSERVSIPVIANGGSRDIIKYEDIETFMKETSCSNIMLSRAGMWNCSIFRPEGLLPVDDVIKEYLKLAIEFDYEAHAKYIIMRMMRNFLAYTPRGNKLKKCNSFEEICDVWEVGDLYRETKSRRPSNYYEEIYNVPDIRSETYYESDDEENVTEMAVEFCLSEFQGQLPKTRLTAWMRNQSLGSPNYVIKQNGQSFKAILKLKKHKYASSLWQKNKLYAEQATAIVCLRSFNIM